MHLIPTIEFLKTELVNRLVEFVVNEKIGKGEPHAIIPVDVAYEEEESFAELQEIKEIAITNAFHCLPGNVVVIAAVAVEGVGFVEFLVDALKHLLLREKRFSRGG